MGNHAHRLTGRIKPQTEFKWRSTASLEGTKGMLTRAINASTDGATVTLAIGNARSLVEICDQALHTEREFEQALLDDRNG